MPSTTLISGDTTIEKIQRSLLYMLLEFHIFIYKKFIANYNSIHQTCYNVVKEACSEKEGTWQRNHISLEFGVPLVYFACKSNNSSIYLKNTVYLVLALCRFTVIWLHPQIISSLLAIMMSWHCPQTFVAMLSMTRLPGSSRLWFSQKSHWLTNQAHVFPFFPL